MTAAFLFRDPAGIRTPNLLIRSQVLYPVKLRSHWDGKDKTIHQKTRPQKEKMDCE